MTQVGVPAAESIAQVPARDVRNLISKLVGKSRREVVEIMGQPTRVSALGGREAWYYQDAAHDSATGQTVKTMEVVFRLGKVASIDFSY